MKFDKRKRNRQLRTARFAGVGLFALLMGIYFLTGLCFFARPSQSTLENRTLSAFPAFTLSGFLDGSWFSGISTWYSDTFPNREMLVATGLNMKNHYGLQTTNGVLSQGTADVLPASEASSTEASKAESKTPVEVPVTYIPEEDIQNQVMEGTMVKDGAVYSGCYFVQDSANAWFDIVNRAAASLEGTTDVWSILIPNNSGAMLDQEDMEKLGGTDQGQEIAYYYSNYSDQVHTVETMDTLRSHNDEYLYFRTDHHWTALGAYYVYCSFCQAKGIEPQDLSSFASQTFEPFYGSYAAQLPGVELTADSVTGYVPHSTNEMIYYDVDPATGKVSMPPTSEGISGEIFNTNEAMYGETGQYMRFINGDQGFGVIDNPDIEDGTTALVIKESYGNCFVPFLVDHYDKVYVADFRYNTGPLLQFCKDNEIDDLILLNNIQLIGSANVVATYDNILQ